MEKPNIKFIHCRNILPDGSTNPRGGLTIAYVLNEKFNVVGWAGAKCHMNDHYNKRVGRMKAAGRLLSATYYIECPEIAEQAFIQQTHEGYTKKLANDAF